MILKEAWSNADPTTLKPLEDGEPFWTLAKRQFGLEVTHASAMVSFSIGFRNSISISKRKVTTLKDWILKEFEGRNGRGSSGYLNERHGILFSICTGFAKRVPLREAIAEVILPFSKFFLRNGLPFEVPFDMQNFTTELRDALAGNRSPKPEADANFAHYLEDLEGPQMSYFQATMLFILQRLSRSGIEEKTGRLTIAWPDERDPFQAIEFSCSGRRHEWLQLLRDTESKATFAVATRRCLVALPPSSIFGADSSCRCIKIGTVDPLPIAPRLLETRVRPTSLDLFEDNVHRFRLRRHLSYSLPLSEKKQVMCNLYRGPAGERKRVLAVEDRGWIGNKIEALLENPEPLQESVEGWSSRRISERVFICAIEEWLREKDQKRNEHR